MDMILELRKDKPNKILVDRYKRIADQQNRAIKDLRVLKKWGGKITKAPPVSKIKPGVLY
jgi:hypothetical protein